MNKLLRCFSLRPTPPVEHLLRFLQQCQTQGGQLIFSHSATNDFSRKHDVTALLKPLYLSRHDKKTLINEYLLPLSQFNLTADDIFAALRRKDQPAFPCQICDNCAPELFQYYGYQVADTNWCSQCFERGECLDAPLIEHYRKYGIDDYTIWRYLPRKRYRSEACPLHLRYQSIEDIKNDHKSIFDAFEAKQRLELNLYNTMS